MWLEGFNQFLGTLSTINPKLRSPIVISLGAIPGALSRYYVTLYLAQWFGTGFPYGTLFANITGSMVMGGVITYLLKHAISSPELRLLIAVGFLGSYTTFSTYTLDTVNLWQVNRSLSIAYGVGSSVLGIVGLEVGIFLAGKLP